MKLLWILALIINVANHGEIPAEGMDITVTETTIDPMTQRMQMAVDGTVTCAEPLTVTITRSASGLTDQFCCAGLCVFGNGETTQSQEYGFGDNLNWYAHYEPAPNSEQTVQYTFSADNETRTLTVHYVYGAQGIDNVKTKPNSVCIYRLTDGKQLVKEIKK